jgi:hypothetical protein
MSRGKGGAAGPRRDPRCGCVRSGFEAVSWALCVVPAQQRPPAGADQLAYSLVSALRPSLGAAFAVRRHGLRPARSRRVRRVDRPARTEDTAWPRLAGAGLLLAVSSAAASYPHSRDRRHCYSIFLTAVTSISCMWITFGHSRTCLRAFRGTQVGTGTRFVGAPYPARAEPRRTQSEHSGVAIRSRRSRTCGDGRVGTLPITWPLVRPSPTWGTPVQDETVPAGCPRTGGGPDSTPDQVKISRNGT